MIKFDFQIKRLLLLLLFASIRAKPVYAQRLLCNHHVRRFSVDHDFQCNLIYLYTLNRKKNVSFSNRMWKKRNRWEWSESWLEFEHGEKKRCTRLTDTSTAAAWVWTPQVGIRHVDQILIGEIVWDRYRSNNLVFILWHVAINGALPLVET